jgi:hypothetical protein
LRIGFSFVRSDKPVQEIAGAIDPDAHLIGFSVREPGPAAPRLDVEHYHRLLANSADFLIDRLDAEVMFIPMERRTFDVQHSHAVVGRMSHAQRATVLKRDCVHESRRRSHSCRTAPGRTSTWRWSCCAVLVLRYRCPGIRRLEGDDRFERGNQTGCQQIVSLRQYCGDTVAPACA